MVLVGYAKCPKCHAPMPAAAHRAKRASFQGGGTSSQPIERDDEIGGESGGSGWILPVLGIVLVAAIVIWATALRGGGGSTKKPAEAAAPVDDGPGTGSQTAPPSQNDNQAQTPTLQTRPDPAYVADALEAELSVERLFSTVDVIGELLEVRSAFCSDPRFSEITAKYVSDLRAAGVLRIRCSETHGAQVFARAL